MARSAWNSNAINYSSKLDLIESGNIEEVATHNQLLADFEDGEEGLLGMSTWLMRFLPSFCLLRNQVDGATTGI